MASVNRIFKNMMISYYSLYFSSIAPGHSLIYKTHEIQGMMKWNRPVLFINLLDVLMKTIPRAESICVTTAHCLHLLLRHLTHYLTVVCSMSVSFRTWPHFSWILQHNAQHRMVLVVFGELNWTKYCIYLLKDLSRCLATNFKLYRAHCEIKIRGN